MNAAPNLVSMVFTVISAAPNLQRDAVFKLLWTHKRDVNTAPELEKGKEKLISRQPSESVYMRSHSSEGKEEYREE